MIREDGKGGLGCCGFRVFKYYKRSMIGRFLIVVVLVWIGQALHLRTRQTHDSLSSTQLRAILQDSLGQMKDIEQSIDRSLTSLNPYNQQDRIKALESAIITTRKQLLNIYTTSAVPLDNQQYSCQAVPPMLAADLKNTLDGLKGTADQLSQLPALKNSSNSLNSLPTSISATAQAMKDNVGKPGTVVGSAPKVINQNNLIAPKWVVGNMSVEDLSKLNQPKNGENALVCPIQAPFVDVKNECISCLNYYNAETKSCMNCSKYDSSRHICNDVPIVINNNANHTNNTNNNESGSNGTNSITPPPPPAPAPRLRISNTNNFNGLLLPQNISLQDYKQTLLLNSQNQNVIPCPQNTPFFDGTACIVCPSKQYFSSTARACQTCPAQQIYNPSTFHCDEVIFYSNPEVKKWTSIGKTPSEILKQLNATSQLPKSQPCPIASPYFDGKTCISCPQTNPIFSYDGMKCTNCIIPTIFDPNIYSCASKQRMQTNPTNATNLILEGRSLNEWKTIYFNTQTADPEVSDCPSSKPFFDGITCISCSPETPYFNLQYHLCQNCPADTQYDSSVKECLSTSGNIVTQSPSVLKMAAGIFA